MWNLTCFVIHTCQSALIDLGERLMFENDIWNDRNCTKLLSRICKNTKIINLNINTQIENVTTISERIIDLGKIFLSLCLSESRFLVWNLIINVMVCKQRRKVPSFRWNFNILADCFRSGKDFNMLDGCKMHLAYADSALQSGKRSNCTRPPPIHQWCTT